MRSPVTGPSVHAEDAGSAAEEPLLLDGVLEGKSEVFLDQPLVWLPHQPRREPDEDLVLDQGVAELDQHLPARAPLAEILGAMGGGVEVELGMPPHEGDHLVHPWPAAEASDDGQLGEVDRDLVEVARVAEIVGAIRGVVHGRVDAHGNVELRGLGVEGVVAPIAGGNAVHEGGDAEGLELLLAHAPLQLAHTLRSEEHTSELQSRPHLVCRLLLEKKKPPTSRQGDGQNMHTYNQLV